MTEGIDGSNLQDTLDLYKYVHTLPPQILLCAWLRASCVQGRFARGRTGRRCTGLAELFVTNYQGHRPALRLVTAVCPEASIFAEADSCSGNCSHS